MYVNSNSVENFYSFRGKTFACDANTIRQLNYALALNQKSERYELVNAIATTGTDSAAKKDSAAAESTRTGL